MDMEKMTILTITNMYPSRRRPFIGTFVKSHQEELHRLGISADLVADRGEGSSRPAVVIKYLSLLIRSLFAALKRRYDLIHAHYLFPTGLIGLLAAKIRGSALVVTSHRGDIWDMPRRSRIHHWLTRKVLQGADQIIAVSQELQKEMIVAFDIPEEKISVIDMGVTTSEFLTDDKGLQKDSLGVSRDTILLLFVGIDMERKGALVLFDAVKRLGDRLNRSAHFYLIGGGDLSPYQKRLDNADLGKRITLLGLQPHDQTRRWVRAADVFILPSYGEGLPVSVMEAMAGGCAIVSTKVGGIPQLIENGKNGLLVTPGSDEELAEALHQITADPAYRRAIAAAGISRIQDYDTSHKVREILSIYSSILNRS